MLTCRGYGVRFGVVGFGVVGFVFADLCVWYFVMCDVVLVSCRWFYATRVLCVWIWVWVWGGFVFEF